MAMPSLAKHTPGVDVERQVHTIPLMQAVMHANNRRYSIYPGDAMLILECGCIGCSPPPLHVLCFCAAGLASVMCGGPAADSQESKEWTSDQSQVLGCGFRESILVQGAGS
jgi:hypothetical protein